jgi:exodeoxyribonuclease-3
LKIGTFNINNVRKRLPNLLYWLESAGPDVVCLQELRCTDAEFPAATLEDAGYGAAWVGQRSWNGVAILARDAHPVVTRRALPGDPLDDQARYLEAAVGGVLIGCLYLPNGNPAPGPKFEYKLKWMARLEQHAAALWATGLPVVLAGDYNVVPSDADIYRSQSWAGNALLRSESREAYARLLGQGWIDALRAAHPTDPMYTFWDYKRERWPRDAGLRLDHVLLSGAVRLRAAGVDRAVRGAENASDHAPAWVEVAIRARPRRARAIRLRKVLED